MADKSKTQEAIGILDKTRIKLAELFTDNPGMILRINSVFNSLSNSLKHTIDASIQVSDPNITVDREPLKSVFGKKLISEKGQEPFKPIDTNQQEFQGDVEKLRFEVDQIIPTLLERDASEILTSIEELHLRAIGKKLGLAYDNVNINLEYVKSIQATLAQNKANDEQREEMKLNVDQNLGEEAGNNNPEETIQHTVSKEDLKNNPELGENGIMPGDDINISKKDDVDVLTDVSNLEREDIIPIYTALFGDEPHHNTGIKTIRKKIEDKQKELSEQK